MDVHMHVLKWTRASHSLEYVPRGGMGGHVRGASGRSGAPAKCVRLPAAVPHHPVALAVACHPMIAVSVGVGFISSRFLLRTSYLMTDGGEHVVMWGGSNDIGELFLSGSFLLKFIQKMTSRHWCAVPILFLSKALASVPRCKALGLDGLLALR